MLKSIFSFFLLLPENLSITLPALQAGLKELAVCVTRMCQMYLGLTDKDINWCNSADEMVCHNLMDYIVHSNKEAIVEFIRQTIKVLKSAKEIARPIRLLCEYKVFVEYTPDGEQYRLPYKAFINAFPEVKGLITMKRYNDWINILRTSYEDNARHNNLKVQIENVLSL